MAGSPQGDQKADPARTISGVIQVAPNLAGNVAKTDRLIILLFDPAQGRPVANKIIDSADLPYKFSISVPPGISGKAFNLRVVTDKNQNPFGSAPGEVIGRSNSPIPLGTSDVRFLMDQPYIR